jgi:hypothetical protein
MAFGRPDDHSREWTPLAFWSRVGESFRREGAPHFQFRAHEPRRIAQTASVGSRLFAPPHECVNLCSCQHRPVLWLGRGIQAGRVTSTETADPKRRRSQWWVEPTRARGAAHVAPSLPGGRLFQPWKDE